MKYGTFEPSILRIECDLSLGLERKESYLLYRSLQEYHSQVVQIIITVFQVSKLKSMCHLNLHKFVLNAGPEISEFRIEELFLCSGIF